MLKNEHYKKNCVRYFKYDKIYILRFLVSAIYSSKFYFTSPLKVIRLSNPNKVSKS